MRIKNFGVSQNSYVLNDIWSTKKIGTDRAFFSYGGAQGCQPMFRRQKKFLNESYAPHGIT
jgi:hypothetical protein